MIPVRFSGASGLPRFLAVHAEPVSPRTAGALVYTTIAAPGSAMHEAALDRFVAEAFPRRTWRTRLVNPRKHIGELAYDLQIHLARELCPSAEVGHGIA